MRNYKRKTDRANRPIERVTAAVRAHNVEGKSLAQAASDFNIPVRSLARYCKKARDAAVATSTPGEDEGPVGSRRPCVSGSTGSLYGAPGQVHEMNDIEPSDVEMDPNSTNHAPQITRVQTVPTIGPSENSPGIVEAGQTLNEALNALNKVLLQQANEYGQEDDECDLYGKLLAKKMRKLPYVERQRFMLEVDEMFIRRLSAFAPVFAASSSQPHIRPGSASSSNS